MLIFAERGGGTRVAEAAADDVYYLAAPCGSLAIREGLPVRPRESCWRAEGVSQLRILVLSSSSCVGAVRILVSLGVVSVSTSSE